MSSTACHRRTDRIPSSKPRGARAAGLFFYGLSKTKDFKDCKDTEMAEPDGFPVLGVLAVLEVLV